MNQATGKCQITLALPDYKELTYRKCKLIEDDEDNSLRDEWHQLKVLHSRSLMLNFEEVIAASAPTKDFAIDLIMKAGNGEIYDFIQNNLQLEVEPVINNPDVKVFKKNLKAKIAHSLAPQWIKIGSYFAEGMNFYNHLNGKDGIRAVELDVKNITASKADISINPVLINGSSLRLEDFNLPREVLDLFFNDVQGCIDLTKYRQKWVRVLPSMKSGKVTAVFKEIPANDLLRNYENLRNYWKKMYGYTLPTEADSMLFYNVHFPISQSSPSDFLYPDLCLVVDKFLKLECDEMKEDIAVEFLSALKSDLQSVCGTPTEITLCQKGNKASHQTGLHSFGLSNASGSTKKKPRIISSEILNDSIDLNKLQMRSTTTRDDFTETQHESFYSNANSNRDSFFASTDSETQRASQGQSSQVREAMITSPTLSLSNRPLRSSTMVTPNQDVVRPSPSTSSFGQSSSYFSSKKSQSQKGFSALAKLRNRWKGTPMNYTKEFGIENSSRLTPLAPRLTQRSPNVPRENIGAQFPSLGSFSYKKDVKKLSGSQTSQRSSHQSSLKDDQLEDCETPNNFYTDERASMSQPRNLEPTNEDENAAHSSQLRQIMNNVEPIIGFSDEHFSESQSDADFTTPPQFANVYNAPMEQDDVFTPNTMDFFNNCYGDGRDLFAKERRYNGYFDSVHSNSQNQHTPPQSSSDFFSN